MADLKRSLIKVRWRLPTVTERFTLDQAKLAEMDLRDRLDPELVDALWAAQPEDLAVFIQRQGPQHW